MNNWLDRLGSNWKSTSGGVAMILLGVAGVILRFVNPEHENALSIEAGFALIAAGLSALGVSHKVERARADVQRIREDQDRVVSALEKKKETE